MFLVIFLINSLINNTISNYVSTIDKKTFHIIEKDLRYLSSELIYLNVCSFTNNYQVTLGDKISNVKRLTDNKYYNDGFIIFENRSQFLEDAFYKVSWNFSIESVKLGNIFFGLCVYMQTDCKGDPSLYQNIVFSGIGIMYFGNNCFHIDHNLNNSYWTTPRHCLSEFELLKLTFKFTLEPSIEIGKGIFSIEYDDFLYYSTENLWTRENKLREAYNVNKASPCVLLNVKDSAVKFTI